ncbi:Protein of unknown function [Loktanella fryxellensis]|uniref:DUF1523 domain-containing protein n=1 Tax=Loktanella fryxellensis TaxID=245187 RepID=A0A1H8CVC4_9RHOB|nr:DUF1523 family protein [Loktanella fryxellensis]SEM98298.1 Protein of unknown function [Loktanella fryxellensis]
MRFLAFVFRALPLILFGLVLHYALPQHDVVRVTSTEVIRTDLGPINQFFYARGDAGSAAQASRDLRLISTQKQQTWLLGFVQRDTTETMVYRNEDTGWIWPPYFKFDSADLQAEAAAAARSDGWYAITHYGWRINLASIYPNAVSIRPVAGPDAVIWPWFNIAFFVFALLTFVLGRSAWVRLRERLFDPTLDAVGDRMDLAEARMDARRARMRRWFGGKGPGDHI